jgi:hypothetical protein
MSSTGADGGSASATQWGGDGGNGTAGANGGKGAASSLINGVGGSTNGGSLSLSQTAIGGAGGDSAGGTAGAGGAATSRLTFYDTASPTQSGSVSATVTATGGNGGAGAGGSGGDAVATAHIVGSKAVSAIVTATGGHGTGAGSGGDATATATAIGAAVTSRATAHGSLDGAIGLAKANAVGTSGAYIATADAHRALGNLVTAVSALASGPVDGVSAAQARAAIGGSAPDFAARFNAVALGTGSPAAPSVTPVLAADPRIAAAFGKSPVFFALGELGGSHAATGVQIETTRSDVDLTVDLTELTVKHDLLLGLYQPVVLGSGFTHLVLSVRAGDTALLKRGFTSVSAAETYFTDHALDLGPLGAGTMLSLKISLKVTTNATNSGFDAGFLIGDPPPSAPAGEIVYFGNPGASVYSPSSREGSLAAALGHGSAADTLLSVAHHG